MKTYYLENEKLSVEIASLGAQLCRVKRGTRDYLWNGNPAFWSWHSPLLFPFVGRLKNGVYRHKGISYPMKQHGFAREMNFELESQEPSEVWFVLHWDEDTFKMYPFQFILHVGYKLVNHQVQVMWRVENEGDETMYFAIGGHPAFYCPLNQEASRNDYFLEFDQPQITYHHINEEGLFLQDTYELPLKDNKYPILEDLFIDDALVIETHQTKQISLCTPDAKPYVTVTFDSPTVGVYSPDKIKAPFVCIEPWYGRCDNVDFDGELKDRQHEQQVASGGTYVAGYTMDFLQE